MDIDIAIGLLTAAVVKAHAISQVVAKARAEARTYLLDDEWATLFAADMRERQASFEGLTREVCKRSPAPGEG